MIEKLLRKNSTSKNLAKRIKKKVHLVEIYTSYKNAISCNDSIQQC